jgi:uncharacterized protein (TIGR03437 family)
MHRTSTGLLRTVALATTLAASCAAAVSLASAVNGASYLNPVLENGKLAPGVLFVAFGSGMGPAVIARAGSFPLPKTLSGTSISATVAGTRVDCIMLYTTASQVAAILPSNTPVGTGTMTVTYNGDASAPLPITVIAHDFGIFSVNQGGSGPGVFTDPVTNAANSLINAVNPDKLIDIWGTGIGAVSGDDASGPLPGDMPNLNIQVYAGSQQARVVYRGRSGCCAGVDQIRIAVPAVTGCYVPVSVVIDGIVSNFTTISGATTGTICSDANGYSVADLQAAIANGGVRVGTVSASRIVGSTVGKPATRSDTLGAAFAHVSLEALLLSPGQPSVNTCWVTQFPTAVPPIPTYLDAGKISASGPVGTYDIPSPAGYTGLYTLTFYPGYPVVQTGIVGDGTLLKPGDYVFTGAGGSKVGPFTATVRSYPLTFNWTNRDSIASVDRSQPLQITWTGGTPGAFINIHGQSPSAASPNGNIGAAFTCWVDAALGSFTVPVSILSALPPTLKQSNGRPQGALSAVEVFAGDRFTATGIDYGITQWFDGGDLGSLEYK